MATLAMLELLLVIPAALFMLALFLREAQPLAQTGRVVDWFSQHVVLGLYVFLVAMPLTALFAGSAILLRIWHGEPEFRNATVQMLATIRAHIAPIVIAGTTLMAGSILVIVAMHMIAE